MLQGIHAEFSQAKLAKAMKKVWLRTTTDVQPIGSPLERFLFWTLPRGCEPHSQASAIHHQRCRIAATPMSVDECSRCFNRTELKECKSSILSFAISNKSQIDGVEALSGRTELPHRVYFALERTPAKDLKAVQDISSEFNVRRLIGVEPDSIETNHLLCCCPRQST